MSANLERQQVGEQFKVLDEARVPERPFYPKRLQLNAVAAGAGMFIGILLAGLSEYRDTSLRTEEQLVSVLKLPVLAIVPVLDSIRQRRRRRMFRIASLAFAIAGVCVALSMWRLGLLERIL
jgi:hypothetical protein